MSWCWSCLRASGFALVPILAVLAFFQLECITEEKYGQVKVRIGLESSHLNKQNISSR